MTDMTATAASPSPPTPVLEARGLVKRYGTVVALNGADFDLYPGEILAVIGDNGAGKSSLIKALSGALIPDEGEIFLDGRLVKFHSPLAGQTANLDSITAVVIGGTSLFGGRGSIVGTLVGALIVGVFRNGLALAGLDNLWQEFTVGLLIIVAVTVDQWVRRISA